MNDHTDDDLVSIIDPENFSWIKVKKYIQDENAPWKEKYQALEDHHVKETTFLLNKCRKLAKELQWARRNHSMRF